MNKSYLLTICLFLSAFTGCLGTEDSDLEPLENVDEIKDESDNTEEKELVKGCMDSEATNYDSEAEVDDGSCEYPEVFQPEDRDELKTAVDEWIEDSDSANSTYGTIDTWDTSLITDMSYLFYYTTFYYADSFNGDISDWDVSSVTDMDGVFYYADSFNGDISDWDVSSVTDMGGMFKSATSFNDDISDWDVSSVTDMDRMFDGTDNLSDDNKCAIHSSFDSNDNWEYDWDDYCSDD